MFSMTIDELAQDHDARIEPRATTGDGYQPRVVFGMEESINWDYLSRHFGQEIHSLAELHQVERSRRLARYLATSKSLPLP